MNGFENQMDQDEGGGGGMIGAIPVILWARRWWIIVPSIIGIVASLAALLLIPSTYRSAAVMLVQSPQLSQAILGGATDDVVDRRMARIKEQVTSRPDLVSIIERYGLYRSMRASKPLSQVIEKMRSSILITPNQAELPGNKSDQKTIAFELSFDYDEPAASQAVTQDLMQRILELDAAGNAAQASNRVQFLSQQAKDLETQVAELQGRLNAVAGQNGGALASNGMMMGGNSGSYDVQIAALQRDNASLLNQKNLARNSDTRDPMVASAEAQLAEARATFSDNHPDVLAAKRRLVEARQLAKANVAKLPFDTIDQQIGFNNSQISALRAAKAQDQAQMNAAISERSRAPLVQQQVASLQQQLSAVNEQYKGVSDQLLAAQAGVRAENEQMGERLSVVEPPTVPDTPVWPDRLLILGGGIAAGIGLGLLMALAVELILRPIRSVDTLAALVGSPLLGAIPVIANNPKVARSAKKSRFSWLRPKLLLRGSRE